ncbi:MAG: hypothetical protein HOO06_12625 [Bdellovibrionaceae bacterium]|mgnify:CR=1 FL=1|jgi:hypothetical protein|nr:hypothetical protein [Pseudobdellovibrionaceae bacterium]
MKYIILMSVLILSVKFTYAAKNYSNLNLSSLNTKKVKPNVKNIKKEFYKFKASLEGTALTLDQRKSLFALEKSLKVRVIPPKLKRFDSRGPRWKKQAIKHIKTTNDLHEMISYADEEGGLSEYCGFDYEDPNYEQDERKFSWESIKKGSKTSKSVAYILTLSVGFYGKDMITGEMKSCEYPFSEYVFKSKLKEGKPVELESNL